MTSFSVLSFNIWGAPHGKHRAKRVQLLGERIVQMAPDVIFFQEVFLQDNRDDLLAILTEGGYPYFHYFASGLLGSGLLTVSKYPIVETAFYRFRLGGKPLQIHRGDYYGGKGIGLARIRINDTTVDCYNLHPHAQYEMDNANEYAVYTHTQLYEAARFINAYSVKNSVVLAGDFNTRPEQDGYAIITQLPAVKDAYVQLHQDEGITFSPKNAYVESPPQRLDYVTIRAGQHQALDVQTCVITMLDKFDLDKDGAHQFSDHYGVWCDLQVVDAEKTIKPKQIGDNDNDIPILEQLLQELDVALVETNIQQKQHQGWLPLSLAALGDIWIGGNFLKRMSPLWAKRLRLWGTVLSLGLSMYFLLQGRVNLEARRQVLESLRDEIRWYLPDSE